MGSPDGRRRGWLRWSRDNRANFDRQSMQEQAYMATQLLEWLEGKPTPATDPWLDGEANEDTDEAPF